MKPVLGYRNMEKGRKTAALIIDTVNQCIDIQTGKCRNTTKINALVSVGGCINCPFGRWETCSYYKSLIHT